jgi:fructokinase
LVFAPPPLPVKHQNLSDENPVWDLAAHYLACLCVNMILMCSPEKIVLSGGVLLRKCLFPKIRAKTQEYLNCYIDVPQVMTSQGIESLIVPSKHGNSAGIVGALFLAQNALTSAPATNAAPTAVTPASASATTFFYGVLAGLAAAVVIGSHVNSSP